MTMDEMTPGEFDRALERRRNSRGDPPALKAGAGDETREQRFARELATKIKLQKERIAELRELRERVEKEYGTTQERYLASVDSKIEKAVRALLKLEEAHLKYPTDYSEHGAL